MQALKSKLIDTQHLRQKSCISKLIGWRMWSCVGIGWEISHNVKWSVFLISDVDFFLLLLDFARIQPGFSQNFTRILPGFCQDSARIPPGFFQDSPRILPRFSQDSARILPGFSQDSSGIPHTEVRFTSFLSGGFTSMTVINPSERNMTNPPALCTTSNPIFKSQTVRKVPGSSCQI